MKFGKFGSKLPNLPLLTQQVRHERGNMSALMNIEHVDFTYSDGSRALKNVTLDIYSGEKLAVLGANGAGKSTLFLNMNGILRPSSEKYFLKERRLPMIKKV